MLFFYLRSVYSVNFHSTKFRSVTLRLITILLTCVLKKSLKLILLKAQEVGWLVD